MNTIVHASTKLRSFSTAKLNSGSRRLVSVRHANSTNSTADEAAIDTMKREPNQSSCSPRSSVTCSAQSDSASAAKPDPVEVALALRGVGNVGRGEEERQRADRQVDVERPAPADDLGEPAAERRPDDRRHHHAHPPDRHRLAALVRRIGFRHHRLRQRDQRRAEQPLQQPEHDHFARGSATARTAPEAMTNPPMLTSRKRRRPKRSDR